MQASRGAPITSFSQSASEQLAEQRKQCALLMGHTAAAAVPVASVSQSASEQLTKQREQCALRTGHATVASFTSTADASVPGDPTTSRPNMPSFLPTTGQSGLVLLPLRLDEDVTLLGVPHGAGGQVYGTPRVFASREDDYMAARNWSSTLFAAGEQPYSFYLFELADPPVVVYACLVRPCRRHST